jgi:hypothetical protein
MVEFVIPVELLNLGTVLAVLVELPLMNGADVSQTLALIVLSCRTPLDSITTLLDVPATRDPNFNVPLADILPVTVSF